MSGSSPPSPRGRRLLIAALAAGAGAGAAHVRLGPLPEGGLSGGPLTAQVAEALTARTGRPVDGEAVAILGSQGGGWSQAVALTTALGPGGGPDIFQISLERLGEDHLIALGSPENLSRSPLGRERLLGVDGGRAFFSLSVNGQLHGVTVISRRSSGGPVSDAPFSDVPASLWDLWRSLAGVAPGDLHIQQLQMTPPARSIELRPAGSGEISTLSVDGDPLEIDWAAGVSRPLHRARLIEAPEGWPAPETLAQAAGWIEGDLAARDRQEAPAFEAALAPGEAQQAPIPGLPGGSVWRGIRYGAPAALIRIEAGAGALSFAPGGGPRQEGWLGAGRLPAQGSEVKLAISLPAEITARPDWIGPGQAMSAGAPTFGRAADGGLWLGPWPGVSQPLVEGIQGQGPLLSGGHVSATRGPRRQGCAAIGVGEDGALIYGWLGLASPMELGQTLAEAGAVEAVPLGCGLGAGAWWLEGDAPRPALEAMLILSPDPEAAFAEGAPGGLIYVTAPAEGAAADPGAIAAAVAPWITHQRGEGAIELWRIDGRQLSPHLIPGRMESRPADGAPTGITLDRPPAIWALIGRATSPRGLVIDGTEWSPLQEGLCTLYVDPEGQVQARPDPAQAEIGRWAIQGHALVSPGAYGLDEKVAPYYAEDPLYGVGVDASGALILARATEAGAHRALAVALAEAGATWACALGTHSAGDDPDPVRYFVSDGEGLSQLAVDGSRQPLRLPPGPASSLAFTLKPGPPAPTLVRFTTP